MVKNKNINKADINNGVILTNTSISIETRVKLCEITSTGEYRIMENIPGVNIETISLWGDNNTTTYFKIDTERYPTIQIVGEPVIDDKETPNKPLFYKWTGCIENSSNTIDLSLVIGGIYEIKSWFILDGDLMAKVHLLRYSGEFGKIMGVNVGIYGWKYSMLEKTDKGITIKDESPTPNYLSYNTTSVFDINSVQNYNKRTITGLNYVATSRDVNANLTPLLNTQVFTKTIDENNQLDTNGIAYIDITNNENGCYLYINVSNESSHEFVGFGDDDTNYTTEILTDSIKYIRYIEVSAPLDYSFIANFRKKTNTESSDTTTIKDSFTSLNDMVKDIKMNFSATKNTDTNNISTINKKAVNSGGIKTGVSVGGSIYVGENAFKEASDNKTTLPIILMEDDINQQTVYVEVENINDIINNSNNIDIATNNTTINSIINIASQNAGKTSTEELSVSYDTQLNRQSTVTNTSFKNTTISFNNKII